MSLQSLTGSGRHAKQTIKQTCSVVAKSASDITCSYCYLHTKSVMLHVAATYKMFEVIGVAVKQLRWSFVVLNANPNALDEPV